MLLYLPMAVVLDDIAKIVGVSRNTVSRALREKSDIGQETSRRVREVAEMLGYTPNEIARCMSLKRTNVIGLAVTESDNPVRSEFIACLRKELQQHDYSLLQVELDLDDPAHQNKWLNSLIGRQVDGMVVGSLFGGIFAEIPVGKQLLRQVEAGLPVVVFGYTHSNRVDVVYQDYFKAGVMITEHLISCGYKRISLWGGFAESSRVRGYRQTMQQAGLGEFIEIREGRSVGPEAGFAMVGEFLQHNSKNLPQAIIAINDMCAIGIIHALKNSPLKLKIPDDIAVVGFDNIDFGRYCDPPLTTIGWSRQELAHAVAEIILKQINSEQTHIPKECVLPVELVVRKSCGNTRTES